jgi:hypothetical protein
MHGQLSTSSPYRCEAATVAGFVQHLAIALIARGYWFYVIGFIPTHKDQRAVDEKLIDCYGIHCSKWARCRRKARGLANVQYLRYRRFFVLAATSGEHIFFHREARIQDVRRNPIHCFGYTIGCYGDGGKNWRASVRIERELFFELRKEFLAAAVRQAEETLGWRLASLPFEAYGPVRRQLLSILGVVNRARAAAGLELVPIEVLRLRRTPASPFGTASTSEKL